MEHVVLVDEQDREVGQMEKMAAHLQGKLHRAFSVFIFDSEGSLMLQQRAEHKYHSGGLWTNTCCSHPRPGEDVEAAAHRRLMEEMGFDCEIRYAFSFLYRQKVGDLIEHELDHVYVGTYNAPPAINPNEVAAYKNISMANLRLDMDANPDTYTVWFQLCLDLVETQAQAGFPVTSKKRLPIGYID